MFVYLTKQYIHNNVLEAIEVIKFDNLENLEFEVISRINFRKLDDPSFVKDFELNEFGYLEKTYPVQTVDLPGLSYIPKERVERLETIPTIFDLLQDLSDNRCGYASSLDDLEDRTVYLPTFNNIRVSKSTMSISISTYKDDKGWKTEQIIKVEGSQLKQNKFYCLVPKSCSNKFRSRHGLIYERDIVVNSVNYEAYLYNCSLPICGTVSNKLFCNPLICHCVYLLDMYDRVVKCLEEFKNTVLSISKSKPESSESFSRNVRRVEPYGIFFKLQDDVKGTREFFTVTILKTFSNLVSYAKSNGVVLTREILQEFCSENVSDYRMKICLLTLFDVWSSGRSSTLDPIDVCVDTINTFKSHYLGMSLYLYNMRVSAIYNDSVIQSLCRFASLDIIGSIFGCKVRIKLGGM